MEGAGLVDKHGHSFHSRTFNQEKSRRKTSGKSRSFSKISRHSGDVAVKIKVGADTFRVSWGGVDKDLILTSGAPEPEWIVSWLHSVFEYMTALEVIVYQRVCKNWKKILIKNCSRRLDLDLDVFWGVIGTSKNNQHILEMLRLFPKFTSLGLGYCSHLSDNTLKMILTESKRTEHKIRKLDLFYCYNITSKGVSYVVEYCPNIRHLVLNFCISIDEESIIHLSKLKHLEKLEMSSVPSLTSNIWTLFREYEFKSLKELRLENCVKVDRRKEVAELQESKNGSEIFSCGSNNFCVQRESINIDYFEEVSEIDEEDGQQEGEGEGEGEGVENEEIDTHR